MVKYTCERCNKEFHRKSVYNYHINRKNPCIDVNDTRQKPPILPPNPASDDELEEPTKCEACLKVFTRKDTLLRHINFRCKPSLDMKEEIINIKQEIAAIKLQNQQLITTNNSNNTHTSNNQSNNTNSNNNVVVNNTVIIRRFGFEDYQNLHDNIKVGFVNSGENCVSEVLNGVHLNDNSPENFNVLIQNINDKIGFVFGDNYTWKSRLVKHIITEILDNIQHNMRQYIDDVGHKCLQDKVLQLQKLVDDIFYNKNNISETIGDEIKRQLVNNSHKVNVNMDEVKYNQSEEQRIKAIKEEEERQDKMKQQLKK